MIGHKTWDRICGNCLGFFFIAVTAQKKISGMLGVNVALNHVFILQRPGMGRLIGPKTWDRSVRIFGGRMEQPVTAPRLFRGCLGVGWSNLCIKWLYGMHWAGNGRGFRVH